MIGSNVLQRLLCHVADFGVHGDAKSYLSWLNMLLSLEKIALPSALTKYQQHYDRQLTKFRQEFQDLKMSSENLSVADMAADLVSEQLEILLKQNKLILTQPYNEFRAAAPAFFNHNNQELHCFVKRELEYEPMQWVRSQLQNFAQQKSIAQESIEDLVIVAMEATENCIKYSSDEVFYYSYQLNQDNFTLCFINSVPAAGSEEVTIEKLKEKYREDISLMRGILVMDNLLDSIDLDQDLENNTVSLTAHKKVSIKF